MTNILPNRVADYFCIVGCKSLSDTKPVVLSRYPDYDLKDAEFPKDIERFCFPSTYESCANPKPNKIFSFVLTESNGTRLYSVALSYWQLFKEEFEKSGIKFFGRRCICIVSHWPFLNQFAELLDKIYQKTLTTRNTVPVERIISNLIFEIPLPPPGKIKVYANFYSDYSLCFSRPPPNKLPMTEFNYTYFLNCLNAENILLLFVAVLTEKRILFKSSQIDYLTNSTETLCSLIYPFRQQHVYIPLLPKDLLDFLSAPMPFICGVLNYDEIDESLLDGIVVVDLDKNVITIPQKITMPSIPEKIYLKLLKYLQRELSSSSNSAIDFNEIRQIFLDFFVKILKNYSSFISDPSACTEKFMKEKFLMKNGWSNKYFFNQFLDTQMFQCFIDERHDNTESNLTENTEVLFFNECIKNLSDTSDFLNDTTSNHNEKYHSLTPNNKKLSVSLPLTYSEFPILDKKLFGENREVKPLVQKHERALMGSKISTSSNYMEYFRKKLLFSRNIKLLNNKSNMNDSQLSDISDFVLESFLLNSVNNYKIEFLKNKISTLLNSNENSKTLNKAQLNFKKFFSEDLHSEKKFQDSFHQEQSTLFLSNFQKKEQDLKVLFEEAIKLEQITSVKKNDVERTKDRKNSALNKFKKFKEQRFSSSKENSKIASMINDYDRCSLKFVCESVNFRTLYSHYDYQMVQIIKDVCRLNKERYTSVKRLFWNFIDSREDYLNKSLENLENFKKIVNSINVKKDLDLFLDGIDRFEDYEVKKLYDKQSDRKMDKDSSHPIYTHINASTTYFLYLQGAEGFNKALQQSKNGRIYLKAFLDFIQDQQKYYDQRVSCSLEQIDFIGNQINNFKSLTTKKNSQCKIWIILNEFFRGMKTIYSKISNVMKTLIPDLVILKTEIKNTQAMIVEQRKFLLSELNLSSDDVTRSEEKRTAAKKAVDVAHLAYNSCYKKYLQPSIQISRLDLQQAYNSYKSADLSFCRQNAIWSNSRELYKNTDINFNITSSYLLILFQQKEKLRYNKILNALKLITKVFNENIKDLVKYNNIFKNGIESLDLKEDLQDFYMQVQNLSNRNIDSFEFSSINVSSYSKVIQQINNSLKFIENLSLFYNNFLNNEDTLFKAYKKISFTLPKLELQYNGLLDNAIKNMFNSMRDFIPNWQNLLSKFKKNICVENQNFINSYKKSISDCERNYSISQSNVDEQELYHRKATENRKKANSSYDHITEKLRVRREKDKRSGQSSKKNILKVLKHSTEQLETQQNTYRNQMKDADNSVNTALKLVEEHRARLSDTVNQIYSSIKNLETSRFDSTKGRLQDFLNFFCDGAKIVEQKIDSVKKSIRSISVEKDMRMFLKKMKTKEKPPTYVLDFFYKRIDFKSASELLVSQDTEFCTIDENILTFKDQEESEEADEDNSCGEEVTFQNLLNIKDPEQAKAVERFASEDKKEVGIKTEPKRQSIDKEENKKQSEEYYSEESEYTDYTSDNSISGSDIDRDSDM